MKGTQRGRFVDLGTLKPPGAPERAVNVYIPPGVDPDRPHATLYLFDGQNVFGDEGSYAGGWHAHAATEKLGVRSTQRPVVVAIGNGGSHRIRELGKQPLPFVESIVRTLIPRVEGVVHGRGPRVVGGSSLGGLASLHAWITWPDVFAGAMAMSPSLWFANQELLRRILSGATPLPEGGRLYLDAGARENGRMLADTELLASRLSASLGDDRLLFRADPKGRHHESHWRRRLPKALRFLFRRG